ncbi:MAG: ATP-binding protein [Nibricoccus sp.]
MKKKSRPAKKKPRATKRVRSRVKKKSVRRAPPKAARKSPVPAAGEKSHTISRSELQRLQDSLREAQETLDAIRSGEVDAVVVSGGNGNQIYSLAGAEQPYRVYVERMQEGAVTISADGLILYCNHRFAEMLREPLERVIGSDISNKLEARIWKKLSAVFSGDGEIVTEVGQLIATESQPLTTKLTASHLPIEGGLVMCLVVTDLTAEKIHAETRMAKEVAEQANASKDAFLAALSHELRTPLTPVLTTITELAEEGGLPAPIRGQLEMARRNVELEARLIDDLLDLTRIARGKLELRKGPVDLHAVLDSALEICSSDVQAKKHTLRVEPSATQFTTEGDVVRLQQAMWNLIRNAVKFTPEGGEISIRTGVRDGLFWIEVSDNGVGFDPSGREKIFQAFEQGGRHVTRQFGGLGLGLAITKSVMEAHGGTVTAESDGKGKGARFTLEIPIKVVGASRPPMEDSSRKQPARPLNILLVEDHKDTRTTMERWLRRGKHTVTTADSATAALQAAESGSFDLVISDLGLPDRSGIELMRELSEQHALQGIAVSGYGMEDDVAKSHEAGFVHHLTKPVSLEKLGGLLAQWSRKAPAEKTQSPAHHA